MVEVVIAAIAGVLGAAIGSWATTRAARTTQRAALETAQTAERAAMQAAWIAKEVKEAQIEIVDASFVEREDLDEEERDGLGLSGPWGDAAVLDVKLRNCGGESAFVYDLQMTPRDVLKESTHRLPRTLGEGLSHAPARVHMEPNHYYRGRARDGEEGGQMHRVSQVLQPGEATRFLVSIDPPGYFFRADVKVYFNAGRMAEVKELEFLGKPSWDNVVVIFRRLRMFLRESGESAEWDGQRMPAVEAGRRCFEEYDRDLSKIEALYVQAGRTSHPEYLAIGRSRVEIPRFRRALGLDEQPQ
ncbi:hypothetical protein [Streptomyces hydrogenans]|uniref:hypothetical protein n=2 Tax=Streptomyces hydrogenans TaxID=1873719 RepID=UPI0035DAA83A